MKISLIFAPFVSEPSAPGLGIAYLKGYIEGKSHGTIGVKTRDLNIKFHNQIIEKLRNGPLNVYPTQVQNSRAREIVLKAYEMMKTGNKDFYNKEIYTKNAAVFIDFFDKISKNNTRLVMDFLNGKACADSIKGLNDFADSILKEKPDVIAFSLHCGSQIPYSLAIARLIKQKHPDKKIIFGGARITATEGMFEHYLGREIDFLIYGEGEKGFLHLLHLLNKNDSKIDFSIVPNLIFKNDDGKIIKTPETAEANLDELPLPDFGGLDLNSYLSPVPVLPLLTSRGCYWQKCTFCTHHSTYKMNYRARKIGSVINEIKQHVRDGINHFYFVDEMISSARFRQLAEEILKNKLSVYYYALAKPTNDFTPEVLGLMYKSGCRVLLWGLESGCQKILDKINKGTRAEDTENVLMNSHSAGIKNFVYLIIGYPTETKKDFLETIEYLKRNQQYIEVLLKSQFILEEGSYIFAHPEEFGLKNIRKRKIADFIETWDYDVEDSEHATKERAGRWREEYLDFFNSITKFSLVYIRFRDHMLVRYANKQQNEEAK